MAENDYWAYLREQRELRNDELMHYRLGGERSGFSKYSWYKPIGEKAKGILTSAGNYISNTAKNISDKVNKGIHDARTIIRNNIAEGKRTSYGDMKNTIRNWQNENTYTEVRRGPRGGYGSGFSPDNGYANRTVYDQIEKGFLTGPAKGESFKSYKERAIKAVRAFKVDAVKENDNFDEEKVFNGLMDYMDKKTNGSISALKKANENAEREARNKADPMYNDSARPQDAMKEGQAKARQEAKERQEKARKEAKERKKKEEEAKFKAEAEKFDSYIKSRLHNEGITKDSIRRDNILRKQLGMPQLGSYEEVLISKIPEILPYFFGMKPSQKTIDKYTEYFKDLYGITYKEDT